MNRHVSGTATEMRATPARRAAATVSGTATPSKRFRISGIDRTPSVALVSSARASHRAGPKCALGRSEGVLMSRHIKKNFLLGAVLLSTLATALSGASTSKAAGATIDHFVWS